MVNDLGAGVPSRFTPINAKTDDNELSVGVKQIYQGAWNPIMGLTDTYSRQIWNIISDPITFKHPFTGETFPVRAQWDVETSELNKKISVPTDAKMWNPSSQKWENISSNTFATSKVTFNFEFSNWHNGKIMDMNDILHSLYFTIEWGTQIDEKDKTFDTEFTPRASQSIQTIIAINEIDQDTIEVYVDYWHFDENEIAEWAAVWSPVPWEITTAMEKAVIDGKVSFSRSGATSKNVNWLSLIVPNDANIIKEYLKEFKENKFIPNSLKQNQIQEQYFEERFDSSINWIEEKKHAVISNGPFYLETYSPESRTILVRAFEDNSYPFEAGTWSKFEKMEFPSIKKINIEKMIKQGESTQINIETEGVTSLLYFILDNEGEIQKSEELEIIENQIIIKLTSEDTKKMKIGTNQIKIFGVSNSVLKPDIYETNFLITNEKLDIPKTEINIQTIGNEINYDVWIIVITIVAIIIGIALFLKKRF